MTKLVAKVGRPKKYNFDEWKVGQSKDYRKLTVWHTARESAYQYARRAGKKFSAGKMGNGGFILRVK